MPRVGQNPNRNKFCDIPKAVMAVITCLPDQYGYHEKRLEVIQLCIDTMRRRAGMDASLYVWDNGSCKEFRSWLLDECKPDYLTFSHNTGKSNARAAILRSFQPGTIISYSDDDMLFYDNWLAESVKIIECVPNVGVVSGYPVRTQFRWGCSHTIGWLKTFGTIEVGRFIPDEWEEDFAVSIGRGPAEHKLYTANDQDVRATYNGLRFYATGHHCQYTTVAGRLDSVLQWDSQCMPPEREFDDAIDRAGLLRLTTEKRLSRHIGNVADDKIREDAK